MSLRDTSVSNCLSACSVCFCIFMTAEFPNQTQFKEIILVFWHPASLQPSRKFPFSSHQESITTRSAEWQSHFSSTQTHVRTHTLSTLHNLQFQAHDDDDDGAAAVRFHAPTPTTTTTRMQLKATSIIPLSLSIRLSVRPFVCLFVRSPATASLGSCSYFLLLLPLRVSHASTPNSFKSCTDRCSTNAAAL